MWKLFCCKVIKLETFFKGFIYVFLERGEGKKKERERNIVVKEKH